MPFTIATSVSESFAGLMSPGVLTVAVFGTLGIAATPTETVSVSIATAFTASVPE